MLDNFVHTDETRLALNLVRRGESFFITGRAGTGKTMLLKKIVSECRARGKNVVVTAPTGVAAKNAEGQTIHSLFCLKTSVFVPNKMPFKRRLDLAKMNVVKKLDVLIIDEISMVRADVLDLVNLTLQHYKGNKNPFGGIQVLFFGDLFQLPPVLTDDEKDVYGKYYDNEFFFSSDVIKQHPLKVLELTTVHRQKKDPRFVDILNNIREGIYLESDRSVLNERWSPGVKSPDNDSAVYLRTLKRKVWGYNMGKLDELPGREELFTAYIEGDFPRPLYPTDLHLSLKVGAKVMLLRNDNDGYKYVNGTLGTISSILGSEIRVSTDEGQLITVERSTWDRYKYVYDDDTKTIIPIVAGSFKQFPLMLAWAVTIHKSQGMTFDKVVVDTSRSFAPGQVYVALSRCRSLNGLTLRSRIGKDEIIVNSTVVDYMQTVERYIPSCDGEDNNQEQFIFFSDNGKTVTGISSEVDGEVFIPNGVEKIAEKAFENNTNITSISFPPSLREIESHAFWGCKNLSSIMLNEGLMSIGVESFVGTQLSDVKLPSTLSNAGLTPFECKMEVNDLNKKYASDANGILYNKNKTSLILFPRKVHEGTIEVQNGVTCIESYAFENCVASEIILPEGIEELEENLFYGCKNLKTITIKSGSPQSIRTGLEVFKGFEIEHCILRVPFDSLHDYKVDERFCNFKYITAIEGSPCLIYDEEGTGVVGCDDDECENIVIPEGVTIIKENAFENKDCITNVVFPASLVTIECCAFSGCSGITAVELNDGLSDIEWDAFRGTGLSHVNIPQSVEHIGASAFKCEMEVEYLNMDYRAIDGILYSYLEDEIVIYPETKKEKEFVIPDSVETICSYAFEDTAIESLTIPDSIKSLKKNIFGADSNITKLIINIDTPNELDIDKDAFAHFYKNLCNLIVPFGASGKYFAHKLFRDFRSISEMQDENSKPILKSGLVTGQQIKSLSIYETTRSESKPFCLYNGHYRCYVVSTSRGFYLKYIQGNFYFLSDHNNIYTSGQIWIKNKKERLSGYEICYSVDGVSGYPFGYFLENWQNHTITYRDYKTQNSFTIDLDTGEKI